MGILVNYYYTDVRLCPSHWKSICVLAVAYSLVNWYATWKQGEPLYWFLDWKDYKSPLISACLCAFFSALFYYGALLSIQYKPVPSDLQAGATGIQINDAAQPNRLD